MPKYFIVFDAVVNEIISFISYSDNSLLLYRNSTDFCMLILYPAALQNSLIRSNTFCGIFRIFPISNPVIYKETISFVPLQLWCLCFFFLPDCSGWDFLYYFEYMWWRWAPMSCIWSLRKSFQPFTVEYDVSCGFVINGIMVVFKAIPRMWWFWKKAHLSWVLKNMEKLVTRWREKESQKRMKAGDSVISETYKEYWINGQKDYSYQ